MSGCKKINLYNPEYQEARLFGFFLTGYSLERADISYEATLLAHFGKNQNSVKLEKTKLHIIKDGLAAEALHTLLLALRIHPIQFRQPGIISGRIGGRFLVSSGY